MNAAKLESAGTLADLARLVVRIDDPHLDPAGQRREEALVDAVFYGRSTTIADAFAQLVACLDFAHGIVDHEASYAEEYGPKLVRALYSIIGAIEANTGWRREEFGGYSYQPAKLQNLIEQWRDQMSAVEATDGLGLPTAVDDALLSMTNDTLGAVSDLPAESLDDIALKLRFLREALANDGKCDHEELGARVEPLLEEAERLVGGVS